MSVGKRTLPREIDIQLILLFSEREVLVEVSEEFVILDAELFVNGKGLGIILFIVFHIAHTITVVLDGMKVGLSLFPGEGDVIVWAAC